MAAEAVGRRIALVLGAGGARGLAHIGVIEALEARGFSIAAIAGASMGALVGGIHAAGHLPAYRDWIEAQQRSDILRLLDVAFGAAGLIRGERVIATLRELVGEHRIEDLPIPFVAVATDLATQREVWLQSGPLFDAIRASIAIPMVFTPHVVDGRELVDGGLLAPVPLTATRGFRCDAVIAVDLNGRSPRVPGALAPPVPPVPTVGPRAFGAMLDLMSRSLDTMHSQMARLQLAQDPPDLVIRLPRDAAAFYEYWRARELRELGRRAAEAALDEWH